MLPARLDAANDPSLTKDLHYAEFIQQVKLGRHYPVVTAWGQLENVFRIHIANIVTSLNLAPAGATTTSAQATIKNNLQQASQQANAILKAQP
jgi:maltose-binding protein MalE